jgi:hypothetical protein
MEKLQQKLQTRENNIIDLITKYEENLKSAQKIWDYNKKCFAEFEQSEEKKDYGRMLQYIAALRKNQQAVEMLERFLKDLETLQ